MNPGRTLFPRTLSILTVVAGLQYILWRFSASINFDALWLSIPFILAETYGIVDMTLFLMTMWKPKERIPPAPPQDGTVDVFITTYNEDVSLVEKTARAACRIRWPSLRVYLLDDGARSEIKRLTEDLGCGYITRGEEWTEKPRHAKAGNVNNAIVQTTGDFILILDADQIPSPNILERTLGYFEDPLCAFVQTPQHFYNIPPGDPFGTDAPLFYGPIMRGKDGWNAAFFCGSNAVLRREALVRLGLVTYVKKVEESLRRGIKMLKRDIARVPLKGKERRSVRAEFLGKLSVIQKSLRQGKPLGDVSDDILRVIREAGEGLSKFDLAEISSILQTIPGGEDTASSLAGAAIMADQDMLAARLANAETLGISRQRVGGIDLTRGEEAIPVQALDTDSITEDMATALRLHALGFRSVFHKEILALGLAPEDLGTSVKQRLRWAQGTIQVFVKENPLTLKGLTLAQRLMYFATIYSYFSGFSNLILISAPVLWFFTGIAPVSAWSREFFLHLVPFLLLNRVVFLVAAGDLSIWRNEQYNLALFPLWIRAVISVVMRRKLSFVVTAKHRQTGSYLHLVWPQLLMITLTVCGILFAGISLLHGSGNVFSVGYLINASWGIYNCVMLFAIVRAAVYQPPAGWTYKAPDYQEAAPREL